jgi:polysaccharide export outer membrane protein
MPCTGRRHLPGLVWAVVFALWMAVGGCGTPDFQQGTALESPEKPESLVLREGDTLKISFPGAPNLNTTQQIRRDGKISLSLVGEVSAAGLTPEQLEKKLIGLYAPQLVTKEVTVTVESSSFPVYVTGAVLRPGKVTSERPITALEAIMEAGGFDYTRANLKSVRVIRNERGHIDHYTLNLKQVLAGQSSETFYLKPMDIVYVPERFTWF